MRSAKFNILFFCAGIFILSSCTAPVLYKGYMQEGSRTVSFAALRENPGEYEDRLFILGGVIVRTRLVEAGSQIEALHVPVDNSGYFEESGRSEGRYLALLPKDGAMLDPAIYRRGRRVTLAAEFVDVRKGKIDEMDYAYPVFRIKQVYLWPKERLYYYPPPFYFDPWFYPYPYYYGHPWWFYPHYNRPVHVTPERPRTPPPSRTPAPEPRR
jgi:outer membrane lipoprotein